MSAAAMMSLHDPWCAGDGWPGRSSQTGGLEDAVGQRRQRPLAGDCLQGVPPQAHTQLLLLLWASGCGTPLRPVGSSYHKGVFLFSRPILVLPAVLQVVDDAGGVAVLLPSAFGSKSGSKAESERLVDEARVQEVLGVVPHLVSGVWVWGWGGGAAASTI